MHTLILARAIMDSLSSFAFVTLLLFWEYFGQGQANGTCSTEEMRKIAVEDAMKALGCNSYDCVLLLAGVDKVVTASSCAEIVSIAPKAPSGYYWLQSANGSAVQVYCDMTLTCKGVGGGWMQVAKLDMTNTSHQCPPGTRLRSGISRRLCGIGVDGPGCSSTLFNVYNINYSQVCGKIIGYQYSSPDTFGAFVFTDGQFYRDNTSVDGNYVDGISLTYGNNTRKHIWTLAGGLDEIGSQPQLNCPCTNIHKAASASRPPSFVGNDYFCDTGSTNLWTRNRLYEDDPLWDGAGCGPANTCCSLNNPPWFLKQLPSSTAEDIEMRICVDQDARSDEDIPLETIELYVR